MLLKLRLYNSDTWALKNLWTKYNNTERVHIMRGEVYCTRGSYQIGKSAGCTCAGNAGTYSPSPRISDPGMHHGTVSFDFFFFFFFFWGGGGGGGGTAHAQSQRMQSQRMHNPQCDEFGKRPMRAYVKVISGAPFKSFATRVKTRQS